MSQEGIGWPEGVEEGKRVKREKGTQLTVREPKGVGVRAMGGCWVRCRDMNV